MVPVQKAINLERREVPGMLYRGAPLTMTEMIHALKCSEREFGGGTSWPVRGGGKIDK